MGEQPTLSCTFTLKVNALSFHWRSTQEARLPFPNFQRCRRTCDKASWVINVGFLIGLLSNCLNFSKINFRSKNEEDKMYSLIFMDCPQNFQKVFFWQSKINGSSDIFCFLSKLFFDYSRFHFWIMQSLWVCG